MADKNKSIVELYNQRSKRIRDATALKVPDRIPISIEDEGVFVKHGGFTWAEVMYDVQKAITGAKKLWLGLDQDTHSVPFIICPGQIYDILNFKQVKWAGAKLAENKINDPTIIYQFMEPGTAYEPMYAQEYDWFLNDPTDYIIRGFWSRACKALEPLKQLPALWHINGYTRLPLLAPLGRPEITQALESLIEVGREALKFNEALQQYQVEMVKLGYPPRSIGYCSQSFDYFGDYLRGTTGRMLDMYRNPEKLKEAIDKITPMITAEVIAAAKARLVLLEKVMPGAIHVKNVSMYLHGGAGGFMSNEQYKEFYWSPLRRALIDIIDAGFTPHMFSEGVYTDRLEIIRDLPKGKVIWHIESDIFKAKDILGDTCCIEGGPPASIMNSGTVDDVKAYAKKLIKHCGKDGGFIMGVAQSTITAKYDNMKALVDYTKEYGVYA